MHSERVQFDSHFLVRYLNRKEREIWNRETGKVERVIELPGLQPHEDETPKFYQLSTGEMIFASTGSYFGSGEIEIYGPYVFDPRTGGAKGTALEQSSSFRKITKSGWEEAPEPGERTHSDEDEDIFPDALVELQDGRVVISSGGSTFIYDRSWEMIEEKSLTLSSLSIVLNRKRLITVKYPANLYAFSLPELKEVGRKFVFGSSRAESIARVSDTAFLVGYDDSTMTMWNSRLERVREFSIDAQRIEQIHVLRDGRAYIQAITRDPRPGFSFDDSIAVFSLDDNKKKVPMTRTFSIPEKKSYSFSTTFNPERQEVIYRKSSHVVDTGAPPGKRNESGVFAFDLRTLKTEKIADPEDVYLLEYIKWPIGKHEFSQAVKRMESLWEEAPIPTDILRIITKFLEP